MNGIYNSITRVELFYILLSTLVFLYTYIFKYPSSATIL